MLIDSSGKVNRAAAQALTRRSNAEAPLTALAFGALKWEHYLGVKVKAPALPADIESILASSCPFFPGKYVKDTHFLILVPKGMTLEQLEALTLNAKEGKKIGFQEKILNGANLPYHN